MLSRPVFIFVLFVLCAGAWIVWKNLSAVDGRAAVADKPAAGISSDQATNDATPSVNETDEPAVFIAGKSKILDASGYVVPRKVATVSALTTGRIVEVLVEEGLEVNAGDVLAKIDSASLDIQLRLAESKLARARAEYDIAHNDLREAELDLARIQTLYEDKLVSASELESLEIKVAMLKAKLARQSAEIKIAEQEVAQQHQFLEDNVIRAPFDGVIVDKSAQPGEIISPSTAGGGFTRTGICTLVDMSSLEIEVDVNELYINRVFKGQEAEAQLDAYPDWQIPVEVIAIVPTADRQKTTIKVRLKFKELDSRILPDMGIRVSFLNDETAKVSQR